MLSIPDPCKPGTRHLTAALLARNARTEAEVLVLEAPAALEPSVESQTKPTKSIKKTEEHHKHKAQAPRKRASTPLNPKPELNPKPSISKPSRASAFDPEPLAAAAQSRGKTPRHLLQALLQRRGLGCSPLVMITLVNMTIFVVLSVFVIMSTLVIVKATETSL